MKPFNALNFSIFQPKNILIVFLKNLYAKALEPASLLIIVLYIHTNTFFLAGKKETNAKSLLSIIARVSKIKYKKKKKKKKLTIFLNLICSSHVLRFQANEASCSYIVCSNKKKKKQKRTCTLNICNEKCGTSFFLQETW